MKDTNSHSLTFEDLDKVAKRERELNNEHLKKVLTQERELNSANLEKSFKRERTITNANLEKALAKQNEYFLEALRQQDFNHEMRFIHFRNEVKDLILEVRNEFFNKIDPFLIEIETAREDRMIASDRMMRVDSTLKNYEHRITKLEHQQPQI